MLDQIPFDVLEHIVVFLLADKQEPGWYTNTPHSFCLWPCPVVAGEVYAARLAATCRGIRQQVIHWMNRLWHSRVANITKRPRLFRHSSSVLPGVYRGRCLLRNVSNPSFFQEKSDFWVQVLHSVKSVPRPEIDAGYTGTPEKVVYLCSDEMHWVHAAYHMEKYDPEVCYYDRLVDLALKFMHRVLTRNKKREIDWLRRRIKKEKSEASLHTARVDFLRVDLRMMQRLIERGDQVARLLENRKPTRKRKSIK